MQDPLNLVVYRKAEALAEAVVRHFEPRACRRVPGLRNQAVRAATSIPDAIAEGCGKASHLELARYCDIALGSAGELRAQLRRAARLRIIAESVHAALDALLDEVRRMLFALARAIRSGEKRRRNAPQSSPPPNPDLLQPDSCSPSPAVESRAPAIQPALQQRN